MFTAKSLTLEINRLVTEGFRITVFQDVPEDPSLDPLLRAREAIAGAPLDLSGLTRRAHLQRSKSIRLEITSAVSKFAIDRVRLFDLADPICKGEKCLYHVDGLPIYLDSNHLTFTGAAVVAPLLRDALTQRVP